MNEERLDENIVEVKEETTEETMAEESQEGKAAEPVDIEKKIAELEDRYLRKLAEFDNYRKRMARDLIEARNQVRCSTIEDFLTVYDTFSMGLAAIKTATDMATIQEGMEMVWAEFQRVLEGFDVKEIESVGKPFDANFHEAVSQEASDTVEEGSVIRQWKAGFTIGDKLLRPAVVVVSSGPAVEEESKAEEPSEG